jgi:hypothetical protein
MQRALTILLFISISLFSSCSKPELDISYEVIELPISEKVRCLEVKGDSLLIGGGNLNTEGFLIQSDLALTQFNVLTKKLKHEVYDITQFKNRWYIGLDSVEMVVSDSLTSFRTYYWREEDWVSDLSKHPIRRFAQTNNGLYAITGGELSFGVIYQTNDANEWNPLEFENELRALCAFDNTVWVAGNGRLMRLTEGIEWQRIDLKDEFIADMVFTSQTSGLAITFDGSILITSDGGDSWSKAKNKSKGFLNRVVASGDQVIAIGNAGLIGISNNNGENWKWYSLKEEIDLMDAVIVNGDCIIGGDDGMLVRFSLASLK